jgi:hypothetical protein
VLLLLTFCLISCSIVRPIELIKKVALTTGVDFDSKKLVVTNPDTGEESPPCIQNNRQVNTAPQMQLSTDNASDEETASICMTQLNPDKSLDITKALELSKKPIEGKIIKNGVVIPATYVVTVTAVYKGSHCNTTSSGGDQHEHCHHHR